MTQTRHRTAAAIASALLVLLAAEAAQAQQMHPAPSAPEVRQRALDWAAARGLDEAPRRRKIVPLWDDPEAVQSPRAILDTLVTTFAVVDAGTQAFLEACAGGDSLSIPAEPPLLADGGDTFYRANVSLFFGRYLAQRRMYDEALSNLKRVDPRDVVDPATYFFYKAVCEHQLLRKTEALATLDELLKNTEGVPVSYSTVASLMQYDLKELNDQSLGEVARKMKDSERRLDLGRGGQRVQKVQSEIIATLDEIIKKIEQQQSSASMSNNESNGQGGGNQSNAPAGDSRIKGEVAPGEVDPRELEQKGGWGALNPQEKTDAKNIINQKFPNHYREAVEEYFKKLANRRPAPGK
jgi:hypothetical protein